LPGTLEPDPDNAGVGNVVSFHRLFIHRRFFNQT
jgi:hypothetical protein